MNSAARRIATACLVSMVFVAAHAGCHMISNPYVDELAHQPPVTTASVEGARAAEVSPIASQRSFAAMEAKSADGTVSHGPLYFEDGFEDAFDEDDTFAWTGGDWTHWMVWRVRFLVNTAMFPISALVTPPWRLMVSDGRASRSVCGTAHDAGR